MTVSASLPRPRVLLIGAVILGCWVQAAGCADVADGPDPISYGGGSCGRLTGGRALPCGGDNYESFSAVACLLGRNYLHPWVADIVTDAFGAMATADPRRVWQYGDLGHAEGGDFWPHKTHQAGVSVDFFFPVRGSDGAPATVPISWFNTLGYGLDFDADGRLDDLAIDWSALASHLVALGRAAKARGMSLRRVILAPALQKKLLAAAPAARPLASLFNRRRAWVLHDEHYHVDFVLPPRLRAPHRCD